jgi:hypothetical protein
MTMPSFLIIGAAKSGTSALYEYLKQHPEIYMSPQKETNFFAFEGQKPEFRAPDNLTVPINQRSITCLDKYKEQFQGVSTELAVGEASTIYLYHQNAPFRIRHHVPDSKLIAILRNPVDRAFSSFLHLVRDGRETIPNFAQALCEESQRIENNWAPLYRYTDMGFYYVQLSRYFESFDGSQIRIYLYEDLVSDPISLLKDIFAFLGVSNQFVPDMSIKYNASGIPINKTINSIINGQNSLRSLLKVVLPTKLSKRVRWRINAKNLFKPQMSYEVRSHLISLFKEDFQKLEALIERDLSHWLK